MADKPKGLYRLISLVFDSAASRKATREMEEALTRAGEVGGQGFSKELQKQYKQAIAKAKTDLANGLIDQKTFDRLKREADETFNRKLGGALQKLRQEGKLTDDAFASLSGKLKKVGDDGEKAGGLIGKAFKAAAVYLGSLFVFDRVLGFFKSALTEAVKAEDIWNNLRTTVESTGTSFDAVRPSLEKLADEWMRVSRYGDEEFAATFQRLIAISGDYKKSLDNVITVADVAARYHKSLEEAATIVGKAIIGETQGFKRLGIVIPEGADALEFLRQRTAGFAENEAKTLGGRLDQLKVAWEDYKKAIGFAIVGQDDAKESVGGLTETIRTQTEALNRHRNALHTLLSMGVNFALGFLPPALTTRGSSWGQVAPILTGKKAAVPGTVLPGAGMPVPPPPPEAPEQRWANDIARPGDAEKAREAQAAGEIAALENINALGLLNATQRARAYAIQKALTAEMDREVAAAKAGKTVDYERLKIVTDRLEKVNKIAWLPESATPHLAPGSRVTGAAIPVKSVGLIASKEYVEQQNALDTLTEYYRDRNREIEEIGQNAAMGYAGAWQDAFGIVMKQGATAGKFMEALGRGMAGALLGGLAEWASGKVKENVASAFEETAKGLAAASNPFTAPLAAGHFAAAVQHGLAAAAWGVLAGGAGAGQSAVAGGGRGGVSGGIPSGASDIGGRIATNAQAPGPEINIYVDGFDPHNPTHQQMVGYSQQELRERWGNDARITYHARTG